MTTSARSLLLLRHAKAEPSGHGPDELRRLDPKGWRQCAGVGAALRATGLVPELVLVSSAVRARETWDGVAGALGEGPVPEVLLRDDLYDAGVEDVIDMVRGVDGRVRTLMLVGHEPTMSAAAARLAGSGEAGGLSQVRVGLPTASYARLDVPGAWSEVDHLGAVLRAVVRPSWRE
jgi:phosphohistidine phosphatase